MEVKKDRRPEVDTTNSKTRPIAYVSRNYTQEKYAHLKKEANLRASGSCVRRRSARCDEQKTCNFSGRCGTKKERWKKCQAPNDARTAPYTSYSGARSFSKDSKTCKGVIVEKEGDTNLRSTQPEDNMVSYVLDIGCRVWSDLRRCVKRRPHRVLPETRMVSFAIFPNEVPVEQCLFFEVPYRKIRGFTYKFYDMSDPKKSKHKKRSKDRNQSSEENSHFRFPLTTEKIERQGLTFSRMTDKTYTDQNEDNFPQSLSAEKSE